MGGTGPLLFLCARQGHTLPSAGCGWRGPRWVGLSQPPLVPWCHAAPLKGNSRGPAGRCSLQLSMQRHRTSEPKGSQLRQQVQERRFGPSGPRQSGRRPGSLEELSPQELGKQRGGSQRPRRDRPSAVLTAHTNQGIKANTSPRLHRGTEQRRSRGLPGHSARRPRQPGHTPGLESATGLHPWTTRKAKARLPARSSLCGLGMGYSGCPAPEA